METAELIRKYLQDLATAAEVDELLKRMVTEDLSEAFASVTRAQWEGPEREDGRFTRATGQAMLERIIPAGAAVPGVVAVPGMAWLRKWRWAAAAVLVFAVGVAATVFVLSDHPAADLPKGLAQTAPAEILPGTNRAVLTIDDKTISLSADKTGIVVGETIAYTDGERLTDAGKRMSLTTPNGGQYRMVLPDGTKVWLNAASSISFPVAFAQAQRAIRVTGEVYLEVAKDRSKPFRVDVNGLSVVEVLGTSFNINAYGDGERIVTTLVEGRVKVLAVSRDSAAGASRRLPAGGQEAVRSFLLAPGQQVIQSLRTGAGSVVPDADLEQAVAWKNGVFNFDRADIKTVMRQLERWYDIRVEYRGALPDLAFRGEMNRAVPLSDIIRYLNSLQLDCRLEGRVLVVGRL